MKGKSKKKNERKKKVAEILEILVKVTFGNIRARLTAPN